MQCESSPEAVKGKTTEVSICSMDSGVVSTPSPDPSLKVVLSCILSLCVLVGCSK